MIETEKESKFKTFIKCATLVGIFSAMALTPECKIDKTPKVSLAEAEEMLKERFQAPDAINITKLEEPMPIMLECPINWYQNFVQNAKIFGAEKALRCSSNYQQPRCGRIVVDDVLEQTYFDLFQYASGNGYFFTVIKMNISSSNFFLVIICPEVNHKVRTRSRVWSNCERSNCVEYV